MKYRSVSLVLKKRCSGQSLVEFSLISLGLFTMLFGVIEICRFVLVYNTIADGARVGVRYATVHGATVTNGTSHSATCDQIAAVVNQYLGAATVQTRAGCTTSLPCPAGPACIKVIPSTPGVSGTKINVTVSYRYNPLTSFFPGFDLSSTSQGVIAF